MLIYVVYSQYDPNDKREISGGYFEMQFSEHDGVFKNDNYMEFPIQEIPHRSHVWFWLCRDIRDFEQSALTVMSREVSEGTIGLYIKAGDWMLYPVAA